MSKIGEKAISVPSTVTLDIKDNIVSVKGDKGSLTIRVPKEIIITRTSEVITLKRKSDEKKVKSAHGLFRQLLADAVTGVETPWQKRLEIVGTGFTVQQKGEELVFKVGFSHPVVFPRTEGVMYQVEGNNKVVVAGADRQLVGQVAYQIKLIRKPDVYKGKGIRYEGEHLRIKPGKKAKAAGAPASAA